MKFGHFGHQRAARHCNEFKAVIEKISIRHNQRFSDKNMVILCGKITNPILGVQRITIYNFSLRSWELWRWICVFNREGALLSTLRRAVLILSKIHFRGLLCNPLSSIFSYYNYTQLSVCIRAETFQTIALYLNVVTIGKRIIWLL